MENASKALIMAGSVFIALIIIGALILMFNNMSNYQRTNQKADADAQIIEFNNQFETYCRDNVRGSEIYSLFNRVIDYNERKSTTGTEGKYEGFEPIKLKINLKDNTKFASSIYSNLLIKSKEYNEGNFKTITSTVDTLEKNFGNSQVLTQLVNKATSLFSGGLTKSEVIKLFTSIYKKNTIPGTEAPISYLTTNPSAYEFHFRNGINTEGCIKRAIAQYEEYINFKRAKFDFKTNSKQYSDKTGRIINMEFEFTGKFE